MLWGCTFFVCRVLPPLALDDDASGVFVSVPDQELHVLLLRKADTLSRRRQSCESSTLPATEAAIPSRFSMTAY